MRCYAFVLASMYRYSWLITFGIFQNFFFFDRGVGGWGVSYPNFFWIFIYFLYLQGPLVGSRGIFFYSGAAARALYLAGYHKISRVENPKRLHSPPGR